MIKTILSKAKSVLVFKSNGLPTLRILPGYNSVDGNGIENYFKSDAAKAMQKDFLVPVDGELNKADEKQAMLAKEKNDELNKAQRIIKSKDKQIAKASSKNNESETIIKDLKAQLVTSNDMITKLSERLDALESPAMDTEKPADKAKPGRKK